MTGSTGSRPRLRLRQETTAPRRHKARWLGLASGVFSRLFGRRVPPVTGEDLRKHDYPASTQRLGIRFTERLRDTFRFRWLRRVSGEKGRERQE